MYEVNTFLAMLKVHDALVRVSRIIRDRRRRSGLHEAASTGWASLSRTLQEAHVVPLLRQLENFRPSEGYAFDRVACHARSLSAFLDQTSPVAGMPAIKNDLQLVDEFLQPALTLLLASGGTAGADSCQAEIAAAISQRSLRGWFNHDGGVELISLLESYVAREIPAVPKQRVTEDMRLLGMPGIMVSLGDADIGTVFEESALSEQDAWESQASIVGYPATVLAAETLGWYECETAARSLLFAVTLVHQRIVRRRPIRLSDKSRSATYFCEECDKLTDADSRIKMEGVSSRLSIRYCHMHCRARTARAAPKASRFGWLVSTLLQESSKSADFRLRFLGRGSQLAPLLDHLSSCSFCAGGRSPDSTCLNSSFAFFPELMAYHANIRKVAHRLANSSNDSVAYELDQSVQSGEDLRRTAKFFSLRTAKALGDRSDIALARLIHQRCSGTQIARRLGISPSAVSQRRAGLRGSFDFDSRRNISLIWWPFDDVFGPNILRFPSQAIGTEWRHAAEEFRHLSTARQTRQEKLRTRLELV